MHGWTYFFSEGNYEMLNVKISDVNFANPLLTASGTFGYGDEVKTLTDLTKLGGIVTKSVTLNPREGNPPPRIYETASGMLNSIGLANVGVDKYCQEKLPFLNTLDTKTLTTSPLNILVMNFLFILTSQIYPNLYIIL